MASEFYRWLLVVFVGWIFFAGIAEGSTDEKVLESSAVAYTTSMNVLDDSRTLKIGDRLSVRILEDKNPPFSLTVTDSGEVEVPLIGRIEVRDKTCKGLAYAIKAPLEREYFYKATVIVGLDQAGLKSPGRVYVTGQVRTQGPLDIPPDETLTVSKAILRAGGCGDFANQKKVKLVRTTRGNTETKFVNLVLVFKKGRVDLDLPLQPGDTIIVPEKFINF